MYRPSPDRLAPFARVVALLVLTVLALGLPQLLQLCRHDGGPVRIEFVGGPGCCDHVDLAYDAGEGATDGQVAAGHCADHGDCEHAALGVDLQRLPTYSLPDRLVAQPALGGLDSVEEPWRGSPLTAQLPPSTGPPLPERRSAQLVCTILRQ